MENKIKTGIKMEVNEEQYIKVQEICFANGIGWALNYTIDKEYHPYLWVDKVISRMGKGFSQFFLSDKNEEVCADLFIRTNGTCIEPKVEEDKKYLIYVQGKGQPKVRHTLENAETEAKRLASIEVGKEVHIVEVIKAYKSKVIIEEI